MRKETIIFLHIPKTAGTTLRRIIEKQYAPHEQYSTYPTSLQPNASITAFKQLDEARRQRIRLLMGHMPFGLHTFFPQSARYFTILRDPVERVVSHYYFLHQPSSNDVHRNNSSSGITLQRFIESSPITEAKNLQTRLLSGVMDQQAAKISEVEMLACAQKNLQESFDVVGLAERFDETLLFLKNAFHWRRIFYVKLNVTRTRPQHHEVPPEIRNLIQEHNQLDLELYNYAQELFAEQLNRQGVTFTRQLQSFQTQNRLLQPLLHLWWRTPHAVNSILRKIKGRPSIPHVA